MTPEFSNQAKALGFTPLELAQLLDKKEIVQTLQPASKPKIIRVIHEGLTEPLEYDPEHFRRVFGVRYLPFLKFADYALLKEVIKECPLILRSPLGKENRELGEKYRKEITDGYVVDSTIKWIDPEMGYGLFTNQDLPEGAYVGEYTGEVKPLFRAQLNYNAYSFHYPTRFWSLNYFIIDGMKQGNELRFLNHNDEPNLTPICIMDRCLLHMSFVTNQAISAGSELTFNYGVDYWRRRHKV
jgi:hypothetical protein